MRFQREQYSNELVQEMMPLWHAHHAETSDILYGPLDPDMRSYELSALAGLIRIYTVRVAGKLQGYQVFFVSHHPHSKESIQAIQDILFIHPSVRKGLIGYRFIRWCGNQLQNEGVNIVHQRISARNDFGRILTRMGYVLEDLTYSKRLTQEVA